MAEILGGGSKRFIRFGGCKGLPPGSQVSILVDGVAFDVPGKFGPESYVVGTDEVTGDQVQFNMSAASARAVKAAKDRILPGVTILRFKYVGEAVAKNGKSFHNVEVEADDLAPKGMTVAPAPEPAKAATQGSLNVSQAADILGAKVG